MENPTEKQGFNFNQFIEDSKAVLFNPAAYFAGMPLSGGFGEPIIKVLIYGVIIGIFNYLWFITGFSFTGGASWLGGGVGIMAFFSAIIFAVVGLFIGGVVMLIIAAILGGNTDFEANVRVVAALTVIPVIGSVLGFFDGINLYLGAIVSIAVSLWGLYITYHALTLALKAGEKGARIVLIILAVLATISTFSGIAAKKAVESLAGNYDIEEIMAADEPAIQENDEVAAAESEETSNTAETEYVKPDEFPAERLAELSDVLSDRSYLDEFTMNRTMQLFDEIRDLELDENMGEAQKQAKLDSMAMAYQFKNFDDVMNNSVQPALFSATVLSMMAKSEGQLGGEALLKGILSQNPVSIEDLQFTYDNWDRVVLLDKILEK